MGSLYKVLVVLRANVDLTFPVRMVAHDASPLLATEAVMHDVPSGFRGVAMDLMRAIFRQFCHLLRPR